MKKIEIEWTFEHLGKKFIDLNALKQIATKSYICSNYYFYLKKNYDQKDYRNNLIPLETFEDLNNKYPKKKNVGVFQIYFLLIVILRKKIKLLQNQMNFIKYKKKHYLKGNVYIKIYRPVHLKILLILIQFLKVFLYSMFVTKKRFMVHVLGTVENQHLKRCR